MAHRAEQDILELVTFAECFSMDGLLLKAGSFKRQGNLIAEGFKEVCLRNAATDCWQMSTLLARSASTPGNQALGFWRAQHPQHPHDLAPALQRHIGDGIFLRCRQVIK